MDAEDTDQDKVAHLAIQKDLNEYVPSLNPKFRTGNAGTSSSYTADHHPIYLNVNDIVSETTSKHVVVNPRRVSALSTVFRIEGVSPDLDEVQRSFSKPTTEHSLGRYKTHPFHLKGTVFVQGENDPSCYYTHDLDIYQQARVAFGDVARHFAVVLPVALLNPDARTLSDLVIDDSNAINPVGDAIVSFIQLMGGLLGCPDDMTFEGIQLSSGRKLPNEEIALKNANDKRLRSSISNIVFPTQSMLEEQEVVEEADPDEVEGRARGRNRKSQTAYVLPADNIAHVPDGYIVDWERMDNPNSFTVQLESNADELVTLPRYAVHFEYVNNAPVVDPKTTNSYMTKENLECIVIHYWLYDPRISITRGILRLIENNRSEASPSRRRDAKGPSMSAEDTINEVLLRGVIAKNEKYRRVFQEIRDIREWIRILSLVSGRSGMMSQYELLNELQVKRLCENYSLIDPVVVLDFDYILDEFEYGLIVPESNLWKTAEFRNGYSSFYSGRASWGMVHTGLRSNASPYNFADTRPMQGRSVFLYRHPHRVVSIPIDSICSVMHCMRLPHTFRNLPHASSIVYSADMKDQRAFKSQLTKIFSCVYGTEMDTIVEQNENLFDSKFINNFTCDTTVNQDQIARKDNQDPIKQRQLRRSVAREIYDALKSEKARGIPNPVKNIFFQTSKSNDKGFHVNSIIDLRSEAYDMRFFDKLTPLGTFYTNIMMTYVEGPLFKAMGNHLLYMNILNLVVMQCEMRRGYQLTVHIRGDTSAGKSKPFSLFESHLIKGSFQRPTSKTERAENVDENFDARFSVFDDTDGSHYLFTKNDLDIGSGEFKTKMSDGVTTRLVTVMTSLNRQQRKVQTWCRDVTAVISNNSKVNIAKTIQSRIKNMSVVSGKDMSLDKKDRINLYRSNIDPTKTRGVFTTMMHSLQRFAALVNSFIASGVIVYNHSHTVDRVRTAVHRIESIMMEINGDSFDVVSRIVSDQVTKFVYANILLRVWVSICFGLYPDYPALDPAAHNQEKELELAHAINDLSLMTVTEEDILCGVSFFSDTFPQTEKYILSELIVKTYNDRYANEARAHRLGERDPLIMESCPKGFYSYHQPAVAEGFVVYGHAREDPPADSYDYDYLDVGWTFNAANASDNIRDTFINNTIVADMKAMDPHIDEKEAHRLIKALMTTEKISDNSYYYCQATRRVEVTEKKVVIKPLNIIKGTNCFHVCVARSWIEKLTSNSDRSYYSNPTSTGSLSEHYETPLLRVLKHYPYEGMSQGMRIVLPGISHWRAKPTAKQILPQILAHMDTDVLLPPTSPNRELFIPSNKGDGACNFDGTMITENPNMSYDTICYLDELEKAVGEYELNGAEDNEDRRADITVDVGQQCSHYRVWKRFQELNVQREQYPESCVEEYNQKYDSALNTQNRPKMGCKDKYKNRMNHI